MKNTVILCTKFGMGNTDLTDLGTKLVKKYFALLLENSDLPNAICFYTDGVRLTTEDSPILDELKQIEAKGTRLVICSTCLDAMGLTGKAQFGILGGMPDIIEAQIKADKVITI